MTLKIVIFNMAVTSKYAENNGSSVDEFLYQVKVFYMQYLFWRRYCLMQEFSGRHIV